MNRPEPARCIEYPVLRCPKCRRKEVQTRTTRPPNELGERIRYHRCMLCGWKFQSFEAG